jgi:hypothetical protein
LTLASAAPVTVVVGDTVDVQATVTTSPGWLFSPLMGPSLTVTLPGLDGVCVGSLLTAADLVSAVTTSRGCSNLLVCNFGPVGPDTASSVTLRLRGKTPGSYRLVLQPIFSSDPPVTIPFTVVPRVADLAVRPLARVQRVAVGKRFTRIVIIDNRGPDTVSDATLIIGSLRGVTVRATSADGACTRYEPWARSVGAGRVQRRG